MGKKPIDNDKHAPRSTARPGSLLDVVVPFTPIGDGNAFSPTNNSSHSSLLSQIDTLAKERQRRNAENQAVERAELLAKKAAFEHSEQLARLETERSASRRFEEKASNLAAEIERVRQAKFHEAQQAQSKFDQPDYPPSRQMPEYPNIGGRAPQFSGVNENAAEFSRTPRGNQDYSQAHQDRAEFERFQQWQRSSKGQDQAQHKAPYQTQQETGYTEPHPQPTGRQYSSPPPFENGGRHAYADYNRDSDGHSGNEEPFQRQREYQEPYPHDRYSSARQPETNYQTPPFAPSPPPNYQDDRLPSHDQMAANAQPTASGGLYGQNQGSEPQTIQQGTSGGFDLDKVFLSILSSWKMIGIFALLGAVLAGVYAKTLPNKYQAWAELLIDPQGIRLVDKQLSSTGYGGEAMIAYLESQLRIIESSSVLNKVIDTEELFDDPEFSEKGSVGSGLLNILNPLSSQAISVRDRQVVIDNLQDKLTIARGSRTFIISIGMMSESGEKSARIANAIARAYVNGESGARSKIARDASENLSDKLDTLRNRVLQAERKVVAYKAENGLVTTDGKLISEVQLSRINEQLANARIETVNARTKMEQLRSIDLSDVISGALPASLNTGTLSQLRIRYATLKSTADRLSTRLGPKHPERIAASAELESARGQISREIRRSIAGSQKDYERAKTRQKGLNQQLNTVKAAATGTGNSLIALRELERELDAHKQVYENYLLRSRETSEQEGLTTTNARVITVATPPLNKASPNRKVIAAVGLIAGGMIGLMLALLKGMFTGRRPLGSNQSEQEEAYDEHEPPRYGPGGHQPYSANSQGRGYYQQEPPAPYNSRHHRRPV